MKSQQRDLSQKQNQMAAILISDMVKYSTQTAHMSPLEISDFIISYHSRLQDELMAEDDMDVQFSPIAGDASVTIFTLDNRNSNYSPLNTAIRAARQVQAGKLLPTRFGMYIGNIIEANFNNLTLNFGNSFAAASRLEQLCKYFDTTLLFDRTTAQFDDAEKNWMVSIGKVTPKNFLHPIHIYTVYKPGINGCRSDIDEADLKEFITSKNMAMDYFTGNQLKGIDCDFSRAYTTLVKAQKLYEEINGKVDTPCQRILEYIEYNHRPTSEFRQYGMRIGDTAVDLSQDSFLNRLPEKLFKALDQDTYKILVQDRNWEKYFELIWYSGGDTILEFGDKPDGIYFIESGELMVMDEHKNLLNTLDSGDIFGEMAYFSGTKRRNAYVIANTDAVIRKISWKDSQKFPELMKIFSEISRKRDR